MTKTDFKVGDVVYFKAKLVEPIYGGGLRDADVICVGKIKAKTRFCYEVITGNYFVCLDRKQLFSTPEEAFNAED